MAYLGDWFADREIIKPEKMERLFWLYVGLYGGTYNNMLRIQGANDTFDPLVARYVETLREITNSGTVTGTSSRNSTRNGQTQGQTVHSAPDKTTRTAEHSADQYTDTDTTTYTDRARETTRNGTRETKTTGDASKNYVQDGPNSYEQSTHKVDQSTSTQRSGKLISTDQGQTATRSTQADKAAPMTAVNLARQTGKSGPNGDSDAYAKIANGELGPQDWTSASAYRESGQDQGDSRRHEEYYEGDNTVVNTEGAAADNVDRTEYSRNQQTNTELTESERFENYGEKVTDTGSESTAHDMGGRHTKDTETVESTIAPVTDSRTESGSTEETGKTSQTNTGRSEDWYRHTGREGLTPQQALGEALQYLADYPDAILWLISKLEPCFIGIIEED